MALTREQQIKLIEAYEPILYFHPDEKFVPVRPEAYIQASALWCSQPNGHDSQHKKENWDRCKGDKGFPRKPLIPKNGISINPAEDTEGTADPDHDGVNEFYLGHQNNDGFMPYVINNDEMGVWFDMAAWKDSQDVTDTSENKECNVDGALARWQNEAPLKDAVDWYYAEVQEVDLLIDVIAALQEAGGDLGQIIRDQFGDAWFIWYYFLYPLHQEDMRGCEKLAQVGSHGNYEGDWNAVGILVRKPLKLPWEPGGSFPNPEWIGYGMRARGLVEDFIPFFRQQMDVRSWPGGEVRRVGRHPKVFIAKDSHNNYSSPGAKDPPAIPVSNTACGIADKADEKLTEVKNDLEDLKDTVHDVAVVVAKVAVGCAIGGIIGCAIGAIAGAIEAAASGGHSDSTPVDDKVKDQIEQDHPPEADTYGLVLTPTAAGFTLDDASKAKTVRPFRDPVDKHLVDREPQIWWPPSPHDPMGYAGRWGVMCQDDPFDRRSGIEFPDFKFAFLHDLALHFHK